MPNQNTETFHLGLTMAGAVSAGAYTAGVMDYIFETLQLWEKAKNGEIPNLDPKLIPNHQVIIDAMGGTSAGGMTTMISSIYAIEGNIKPVKEIPKDPLASQNLLYDCWVHLDDDKDGKIFSKLWDTDDIDTQVNSLFNSKVIDAIANKPFNNINDELDFENHIKENLPSFISPDLEILLSHTLLRGIPLAVDFKTEIAKRLKTSPKHNTFEHYFVSHFKLNQGKEVNESEYLWLNPFKEKYASKIKLSTISTGAFPIGLAYREFDSTQFSEAYISAVVKRIIYGNFGKSNPDERDEISFGTHLSNFESLSVDGGAINNEPYREVASILVEKFHQKEKEHQNYGLIMIDPFPDNDDIKREYTKPSGLLGVIPKIIQTLWNQSKVKRKEMIEQFDTPYYKSVIYPRKHIIGDNGEYKYRDKSPIASASFFAFGGFLDINFRVHDFFLGRNNARNFVQFYGSFPYDPDNDNVHPIHQSWTPMMVEKFKIIRKGDDRIFLPIVPDINLIIDDKVAGDNRYNYTFKIKPKYDPRELFKLRGKIYNRFYKLLDVLLKSFIKKDTQSVDDTPLASKWIQDEFKTTFFSRIGSKIGSWFVGAVKKPVKKSISKFLTKLVITTILKDLDRMWLLKKKSK